MAGARPAIEVLVQHLLGAFTALDQTDQCISLALYRRLALGSPVALPEIAAEVKLPLALIEERVQRWPGVYSDGGQRIIGYWGLSLRPMSHLLRVDGRELYAWCAWDTLFLPALLGRAVEVSSACRASGQTVRLGVSARAVERAEPEEVVVSFLVPQATAVRHDIISNFCHYVHFFASREAAQPWLARNSKVFLLTLNEAFEVGQRRNHAQYPALFAMHQRGEQCKA